MLLRPAWRLVHAGLHVPDDLRIHFEEPEFTIATASNALVWSFRGEVTADRVRRSLAVHRDLARDHRKGFAVMTIIGEEVPLSMPSDARTLSTSITAEYQASYCGVCEVIEGSGFRSATARSITAGIRLVARTKFPARVFADVGEASRWLAPLMTAVSGPREIEALTAAAERVRRGPQK
jgi:hypothetical protein